MASAILPPINSPKNNNFKTEWERLIKEDTYPRFVRNVIKVKWSDFKQDIIDQDPKVAKEIVENIYAGDAYILQGAYTREFMDELKRKVFEWGQKTPAAFMKMVEGMTDHHRIVDENVSKNYSFESIRHIYYFVPWGTDPCKVVPTIYERIRVLKFLGGYDFDAYENFTPKDGIVDRVTLNQYPRGCGAIETHSDPYLFQRTIMGCKMNERGGGDFNEGGIYYVAKGGKEIDVEGEMKKGDMYISFPTLLHGVKKIDPGAEVNWNSINGRWFLGFYSAVSDMVPERHTGYGVEVKEGGQLRLKKTTKAS